MEEATEKRVVTTQEFWEAMCDPKFVRVGLYSGLIGDDVYLTSAPPELVDGFMENVISSTATDLGYNNLSNRILNKTTTIWRKLWKKLQN